MSSFNDLLVDIQKVKDQLKVVTTTSGAGAAASLPTDENTIFQYLEEAGEDPNRVQIVCNRLKKIVKSKKQKRDHSATPVSPRRNKKNKASDIRPDGSKELKGSDIRPGGSKELKESDIRPGGSKGHKAIDVILGRSNDVKLIDVNLDGSEEIIEIDASPGGSKEFNAMDVSPGESQEIKVINASSSGSKEFQVIDHLQEIFPHLPVSHLKERAGNCSMADIQRVVESILNGDDPQDRNDESVVIIDESPSSENYSVNDNSSNALEETVLVMK